MNCFFNALFMFINNPEVRDINYQIALGLLENGHELDYLTINELAERCFVSTSSVKPQTLPTIKTNKTAN